MAGSKDIGERSDNPVAINVTAMVDVIFCLCIFFMCSFHFKQVEGKLEGWLPTGHGIEPGPVIVQYDVRLVLRWDAASASLTRKVWGYEPVRSDEELVRDMLEAAEALKAAGHFDFWAAIEAAPSVPWENVMHVMDLCKRNGLDRIEFAAPEAPIEAFDRT